MHDGTGVCGAQGGAEDFPGGKKGKRCGQSLQRDPVALPERAVGGDLVFQHTAVFDDGAGRSRVVLFAHHEHTADAERAAREVLFYDGIPACSSAGATLCAATQLMGTGKCNRPLCIFAGRRTYE